MDQREALDWVKAVQVERFEGSEVKVNPRMANNDYRRLNNTTTVEATRELRGLVDLELIEMHGTRRWAYYTLAEGIGREVPRRVTHADLGLNARQAKAMQYLERYGEITSAIYCAEIAPEISQRMARKDLKDLEEQGLVIRVGHTRGAKYVLPGSE